MCGIAGIISLDRQPFRMARPLHNMAKAMQRRGPDDEGYVLARFDNTPLSNFRGSDTIETDNNSDIRLPRRHIESAYEDESHLILAHRRLAILDLGVSGHQPMATEDERYWIVYNGEVYNYREIKRYLEKRGVGFRGTSDTEVVLKAFRRWGPDALTRFNGMFAFAIWDNTDKRLFCARDRIGIKPFYYTITSGMFLFASDIKALIASELYVPEADDEGLYHVLSFGVAPRPLTAFKNVKALPQGSWMYVEPGRSVSPERYWNIPLGEQSRQMDENSAAEMLDDILNRAVKKRLIADVPVGTFMSGGIDSTTVSAIAALHHPGITAFTLAYESTAEKYNELDQAKATVSMYPIRHIVMTVKPEVILEDIGQMILCYEEPFFTLSPNFVISHLVAQNNVTVALNGLGGDELFAGYPWYKWIPRWLFLRRIRPVLRLMRHFGRRWNKAYRIAQLPTADRLHSLLLSVHDEQAKASLFGNRWSNEYNSIERLHQLYLNNDISFTDNIEAFGFMDIVNYIGNHQVYRLDQFAMHFSIEGRFPLLDHELVEMAFRMPADLKIRNSCQKYILRKVAAKYIHPSCLKMEKKGFGLPVEIWIKGRLHSLVDEKLNNLRGRGFFDQMALDYRLKLFKQGRLNFQEVWQLVAVEMWFETFIDRKCYYPETIKKG